MRRPKKKWEKVKGGKRKSEGGERKVEGQK